MAENLDLATLAIRIKNDGAEQATRELAKLGDQAGKTEASADDLAESTSRLVARYVSLAAVAAAAGVALRASIGQYAALESATANLAAKTGLAGEQLDLMVERAKALSGATTQSAAAILDAAEQVEGLVPSLNGNAEAIAEVTRQAVILAEATGDELQPSVFAVGQALEQFGGGAAEAARYANALTAAAQNGAAEVGDLAASMERVGPAAGRAGVSFEETLAAMELLANRGIRGREAVGGLTEFLDRLATTTEAKFSPALVGFDQALANIADANLTAAERTKLFGDTAAAVAATIAGNQNDFRSLAERITGTTAAADQAEARLATFEAQSKMLSNELGNLGAEIGGALVPYLTSLTTEATGVVRALRDLNDEADDTGDTVDTFAGVLRAAAVAGLAFTNTLGLAVRTAEALAETLPGAIKGLTNPLEAFRAYDEAARKIGDDYEATVERILKAQERLTTPDDPTAGVLRTPAAAGAGGGAEARDKGEAEIAARREIDAKLLAESQAAEQKRLEFLDDIRSKAEDALNESTNKQLELQIEANVAAYQTELEHEERLRLLREDRQELLAQRIEEWSQTELEREMERFDEREAAIHEYFQNQTLPNEEERSRRLAEVHEQRERRITDLIRRGAITRKDFEDLTTKQKVQFTLASVEQMTAGLAQYSKTAFNVNKAAGIASAIIDTHAAVTKALAQGGPFAGPVLAAAMLAKGMAQVQAIRGTTFDGGGGGTTPSLAGSTPVVNGNPNGDTAPQPSIDPRAQGQGAQTQIVIAGNTVLDDFAMDRFLERIRETVNDKDANVFGANSRQAQDIVVLQR